MLHYILLATDPLLKRSSLQNVVLVFAFLFLVYYLFLVFLYSLNVTK